LLGTSLPLTRTTFAWTGWIAARTGIGKTERRLHRIGLAAASCAFATGRSRATIGRARLTELALTLSTTRPATFTLTTLIRATLVRATLARTTFAPLTRSTLSLKTLATGRAPLA
jgi:hypothetical protein